MRQTTILLKRIPQSENKVPPRVLEPLVIKNRVKGGGAGSHTDKDCLYEMSLLFACLQDNNFDDKMCGEHLRKFNSCVQTYEQFKSTEKEARSFTIPKPGSTSYTSAQITYLLKKYPNV